MFYIFVLIFFRFRLILIEEHYTIGVSEIGLSDRDERDASVEEDTASQTSALCITRYSTELHD